MFRRTSLTPITVAFGVAVCITPLSTGRARTITPTEDPFAHYDAAKAAAAAGVDNRQTAMVDGMFGATVYWDLMNHVFQRNGRTFDMLTVKNKAAVASDFYISVTPVVAAPFSAYHLDFDFYF